MKYFDTSQWYTVSRLSLYIYYWLEDYKIVSDIIQDDISIYIYIFLIKRFQYILVFFFFFAIPIYISY